MNKMIKRIREDRGGFTLAELLIVVGILLVLIAIAIPVFTGALGKAENAVVAANARSAKSEALTNYMMESDATKQTALMNQIFSYNDEGDEVSGTDVAVVKYQYKVTITKDATSGTVTAKVDRVDPPEAVTSSTGGGSGE
ncbi:MAG: prepilin-type N-terminal cleavage/methylation domain-containing protein [Raoultibacter sp.]